MTAVSLFDELTREAAGCPLTDAEWMSRRKAMAEKLVASALADLDRLGDYERLCRVAPDASDVQPTSALEESLHRLYAQWADEANQVADRARSLADRGSGIAGADRLRDAIGHTRARLGVTPEQLANGIRQALEGQFIPSRELRDEL